MSDSSRQVVKSANRVLDLFELLSRWGGEMTHTEIAEILSIPKSSLSQLLPNLVSRGYLSFEATTKGYRLGERLIALASSMQQSDRLEDVAQPILEELTRITGESSALNVLRGDNSMVIATANSPQRLVSHMRNGDLAPLYATSGGKCLLAFLPNDQIEEYLERIEFVQVTSKTIASVTKLKRQLATIKRERVGFAFEEFTNGIVGIAVPLLSADDRPIGALNIAMPAVRFVPSRQNVAIGHLNTAARTLLQKIGQDRDDGTSRRPKQQTTHRQHPASDKRGAKASAAARSKV